MSASSLEVLTTSIFKVGRASPIPMTGAIQANPPLQAGCRGICLADARSPHNYSVWGFKAGERITCIGSQLASNLCLSLLDTEKEGFEPSVRSYLPYNRLAICRFRPLSHLSKVTLNKCRAFGCVRQAPANFIFFGPLVQIFCFNYAYFTKTDKTFIYFISRLPANLSRS